uniref:COMM domain-containing protein n=1 Tax=Elaeophora elaphi TaxID=1147741 RepID=A0A0R3S4Z7_9BILA
MRINSLQNTTKLVETLESELLTLLKKGNLNYLLDKRSAAILILNITLFDFKGILFLCAIMQGVYNFRLINNSFYTNFNDIFSLRLSVNVAGSDKSNTRSKVFVNIEFRTRNQNGEIKLRNIQISASELVTFLQQLCKIQEESFQ